MCLETIEVCKALNWYGVMKMLDGHLRMKFLVDWIRLPVGELLDYGAYCLFIAN